MLFLTCDTCNSIPDGNVAVRYLTDFKSISETIDLAEYSGYFEIWIVFISEELWGSWPNNLELD